MIHLFNKVYLRHETEYDSYSKSVLLLSHAKDHPLVNLLDIPKVEAPTYEYILATYYDNNIEVFWDEMLNKTGRFDIFVDTPIMLKLLVQFWKSIFVNATSENLYQLLNFYVGDARLKAFIFKDISFNRWKAYQDSYKFISKEDFEEIFSKTEVSKLLAESRKDTFSFEFLLADSYYNPESKYKKALREKVKALAWKTMFHDIEDMKAELINGFYDIQKLVPSVQVNESNITSVEQLIFKEPSLRWMVDEKISEKNTDYVRLVYPKSIFLDFFRKLGFPEDSDFMVRTDLVFDEKYDEYLQKNIEKNFGCFFTGDTMRQKTNQMLACYIYGKIRDGRTEDLKGFELR